MLNSARGNIVTTVNGANELELAKKNIPPREIKRI